MRRRDRLSTSDTLMHTIGERLAELRSISLHSCGSNDDGKLLHIGLCGLEHMLKHQECSASMEKVSTMQ